MDFVDSSKNSIPLLARVGSTIFRFVVCTISLLAIGNRLPSVCEIVRRGLLSGLGAVLTRMVRLIHTKVARYSGNFL